MTRRLLLLLCAALLLPLAACGSYPQDPHHTLERIDREHVVRAGATHAPPLADITVAPPTGEEVSLVTDFAASRGARVEWTIGSEEHLVGLLEEGELDVVVGGITKDTPWQEKAAVTRPWASRKDATGVTHEHVVLAPLGENALVSALERFFDAREAK